MDHDDIARRQNEALGNMMAADARRIDGLVDNVGAIKGEVHGLRTDVGRVAGGIDELRGALTILTRHQVTMEALATDTRTIRDEVKSCRDDITEIQHVMPGLIEARTWATWAIKGTLAVVGLALLALVITKG